LAWDARCCADCIWVCTAVGLLEKAAKTFGSAAAAGNAGCPNGGTWASCAWSGRVGAWGGPRGSGSCLALTNSGSELGCRDAVRRLAGRVEAGLAGSLGAAGAWCGCLVRGFFVMATARVGPRRLTCQISAGCRYQF
jgi:hypothetical protein